MENNLYGKCFCFLNRNNVIKEYQQKSMSSQIQEPAVEISAVAAASKKKRPTQQVYVPKGRRHLPNASPPSTPETNKSKEECHSASDLLIDPSIVGYLKNSPERVKTTNDINNDLEKQMKSMSLIENHCVDNFVNKVVDSTDTVETLDSWDTLYDDTGDCKNQNLIKEV